MAETHEEEIVGMIENVLYREAQKAKIPEGLKHKQSDIKRYLVDINTRTGEVRIIQTLPECKELVKISGEALGTAALDMADLYTIAERQQREKSV